MLVPLLLLGGAAYYLTQQQNRRKSSGGSTSSGSVYETSPLVAKAYGLTEGVLATDKPVTNKVRLRKAANKLEDLGDKLAEVKRNKKGLKPLARQQAETLVRFKIQDAEKAVRDLIAKVE